MGQVGLSKVNAMLSGAGTVHSLQVHDVDVYEQHPVSAAAI